MGKKSGFTLVECAVSCAVVCSLCCIGVPAYTKMKERVFLRGEVQALMSSFFMARQSAIKLNCPVVLQFSHIGYTVFVDNDPAGYGDWEIQNNETLLMQKTLPESITLDTTFTLNRTRFRGVPNVKAGSVTLISANGQKAKVTMNIAGRIRAQ